MVLHMWAPGLTLPAHPALVHISAQRSAVQPEAALQRRLASHATLTQAVQEELALVPTVGAAKRKVGSQLLHNVCAVCRWGMFINILLTYALVRWQTCCCAAHPCTARRPR